MRMDRLSIAVLALGSIVSLSACGEESTAGGDDLEETEITVGVLPLADYAAVYWAEENGHFEEEGLDVTLEPVQGGPIGIQRASTGELDFSFSNTISSTIASEEGAPITTVVLSSRLGPESNIVFVQPDSPIEDMADLEGQTLGINTTNNIGDVTFRSLAESEGVSVEPNFVEVPFNEMVEGVEAGSIDAGYVPEPFASNARQAGMREVVDLSSGVNTELPAATFVASNQFVEENPNTTEAFAQAMYAAGAEISQSEDEFREWLPEIAELPPETAQEMALPIFYEEMEVDELQSVADTLIDQGIIESFDAAEHAYVSEGE